MLALYTTAAYSCRGYRRWGPYAGKLHVRICAGARGTRVLIRDCCWMLPSGMQCDTDWSAFDRYRMNSGPHSECILRVVIGLKMPSGPEFHPEPLTDPHLTLSRHPARATARGCRLPSRIGAPPVSSRLAPNGDDLPPSLHEHYTRFGTTTGQSAPLGASGLRPRGWSRLCLSLASPAVPRPYKSQIELRAA